MLNKVVASLKHKLQKEEGLSVIELMIGTVILITVSAVVASIIVTTSGQVSKTAEDAYYKNQLTLSGKIIAKTINQAVSLLNSTATSIELETENGSRVEIFTTQPNCAVSARTYDTANNIINTLQIIESLDDCEIFTIDGPIITANLSYTTINGTYGFNIDSAVGNLKETKDSGILDDETLEGILFYTASFNNGQPYTFKLNQANEQTPAIQVSGSAPFTYSLHSGALPDVITFNETTGRLIGPAVWDLLLTENNFEESITIKIEDSAGIQILLPIVIKSPKFIPIQATGGIINDYTENGITYRTHTFIAVGTTPFSVTSIGNGNGQVEYLVIAGGGGGGNTRGGGGGAGGYRSSVSGEKSGGGNNAEQPLLLSAGNYSVTVGAGGTGGSAAYANTATNGGNSTFHTITSIGGGAGSANNSSAGLTGGSGGGGGFNDNEGKPGGTGTALQGYSGGTASPKNGGGGGGGGDSAGNNATTSGGGNGGAGIPSSITGSLTIRAGGGGGGADDYFDGDDTGGTGGDGGGGAGSSGTNAGAPAAANTGSGGGGGGRSSTLTLHPGGNGGSGIVIIRYIISG